MPAFVPFVLTALLTAAHFLRTFELGFVGLSVASIALLFDRRAFSLTVIRLLLLAAMAVWGDTLLTLVAYRRGIGAPYMRLILILSGVMAVIAAAFAVSFTRTITRRYRQAADTAHLSLTAFCLTAGLLTAVQAKAPLQMLLLDRFFKGGGYLETALLAYYAAFLVEKMHDPLTAPLWRRRAWLTFAVVFFVQLLLGLSGVEVMLMTGRLHPPVPAVVVAGPLFRGEGVFMLVLFGATLLLVGPAWCSHLCYIGAFDQVAAERRRRPKPLPPGTRYVRLGILLATLVAALMLRRLGATSFTAGMIAVGFGAVGVLSMIGLSRRLGVMIHCTCFCPLGLLADLGGKLNPFRVRITKGCDACGRCAAACRYDALSPERIAAKKPALTCSLCGDCLGACKGGHLVYAVGPFHGERVRSIFLVIIVALHALFLGVARI